MKRIDRLIGMARSLAIYHAIPLRQRRMRRLYAQLVGSGDLVFDVGAHAGNRSRAFAALGCRVIAVEPQPDFAGLLRALFARAPRVTVVESAVADRPGRAELSISRRHPTVATIAPRWRERRTVDDDFAGVEWDTAREVEVTTLDRLIARFGTPAFVKIDVEGAEPAVLRGLSVAVPALSFEYLPRALAEVRECIARLDELGPYRFNCSSGESYRLAGSRWVPGRELVEALERAAVTSGDVYARLEEGGPRTRPTGA